MDLRLQPALDLITRSGGLNFRSLRSENYRSWVARAEWGRRTQHGVGPDPVEAVLSLAAAGIEGHACLFCDRATALDTIGVGLPDPLTEFAHLCWIVLDAECTRYNRLCGGDI